MGILILLVFYRYISGSDRPIQQVIDCGVVPCLIRFLQLDDNPALQLEAAGAIANFTAGAIANFTAGAIAKATDHRRYLIEAGAVPILIRLLSSMNADVRLQAAWALGNLSGDNYDKDVKYRDFLLAEGALPALIQAVEACDDSALVHAIAYALSNLCYGEPAPDLLVIETAFPLLARFLSWLMKQWQKHVGL
jgi:importin subunit alpha-1